MTTLVDWKARLTTCATLEELAIIKAEFDMWETDLEAIDKQIEALEKQKKDLISYGEITTMDEVTKLFYYKLKKLFESQYMVK